ncbi:hypothetical protein A176_001847 [Myxococcus hansupus]|uniref:Uncharacterized protein n=1 Tax=Pseudomyxococcus hansupus TaxID=1297742 RepID=A0A0H4WUF2_9BACT|nr:hypothetical protein A176_001847 [Myxococcus hansupus]
MRLESVNRHEGTPDGNGQGRAHRDSGGRQCSGAGFRRAAARLTTLAAATEAAGGGQEPVARRTH